MTDLCLLYIPVITPELQTAVQYGTLHASLERASTPIGNNDLWIAAHALALELILVSNNTSEFKRVQGLVAENWV